MFRFVVMRENNSQFLCPCQPQIFHFMESTETNSQILCIVSTIFITVTLKFCTFHTLSHSSVTVPVYLQMFQLQVRVLQTGTFNQVNQHHMGKSNFMTYEINNYVGNLQKLLSIYPIHLSNLPSIMNNNYLCFGYTYILDIRLHLKL